MEIYLELLNILNGFIHQKEPKLSSNCDLSVLIQLAINHSIQGILGYMSYLYPDLIPSPCKEKIRYDSAYTIGVISLKEEQCSMVEKYLSSKCIDYVLFKGAVIKDRYPIPELRTFGDIDILIHEKDRKKVHSMMLEQGFTCSHNWEPVYSYIRSNSLFEIHTELLDTDVAGCDSFLKENMWKYTIPVSEYDSRFTNEFHFLYLMSHFAKHVKSSGAGIRMLMDLALMVEQCNLDWEILEGMIKEVRLDTFANYVFGFLSVYLHCSIPMFFTIPSDLDSFMEYIMEAGIFGKDGRDEGVSSLKNSPSKSNQIIRYLFPKSENIQARYTYLQKHRYLLPVAWIHRFILTISQTGRHISHVKAVMKADETEADRLKNMMSRFGL